MLRRSFFRSRIGIAVMVLVVTLGGSAVAATAATSAAPDSQRAPLALPSPLRFVSNLDLECFRTSPHTLTLPGALTLSHLNPVLSAAAPWTVPPTVGPRMQLCSPVAKNGVLPPTDVLQFIRYIDLACYRIGGPSINVPLTLSHLNPLLTTLPRRQVTVMFPEQLCLPVIKNNSVPPEEVLRLLRFIDLVCYREAPQVPLDLPLNLRQLNPVLGHIPPTDVRVGANRQLCVPVRKNNQQIPDDVLRIVRWIDLEKFDITVPTAFTPVNLQLRHVNPLLASMPIEQAQLQARWQLALPMAKNGQDPPAS
jgi:hypothetical protein